MTRRENRCGQPCAAHRRLLENRAAILAVVIALTAASTHTGAQRATDTPKTDLSQTFDVRLDKEAPTAADYMDRVAASAAFGPASERRFASRAMGLARLLRDDAVSVSLSPEIGSLETVSAKRGRAFLTPPGRDRVAALRGFLADFSDAFGVSPSQIAMLDVVADYENPSGSMSWVELEQKIDGIPVFRGYIRGGFTKNGELAAATGQLAADLDTAPLARMPAITAAEAISRAAAHVGWQVPPGALAQKSADEAGRRVTFGSGSLADDARVWQVYFPLSAGVARLAWVAELWGDPDVFLVIVDAADGTVLFRKNMTDYQTQAVTYAIYNDDSPAPSSPTVAVPGANYDAPYLSRTMQTRIGNEFPYTFNHKGWIADGTNVTNGNNVEAGVDRDGVNGIDATVTGSAFRVFNFSYDPQSDNPLTSNYQRGDVANMFYWSNRFHDETYLLGFTEAARNYQHDNFGRGGLGNDRISAESQDSSGTSNANFSTVPDGIRGRMQMYLWTGPSPARSGGLDRDVMVHELAHGLSQRLHANATGLSTNMSRGLGEGWSDFYARALFASADEDINGVYTIGGWVTDSLRAPSFENYYYGIRRFPYARISATGGPLSRPFNPLTFADIDRTQINLSDGAYAAGHDIGGADQVHNVGEVWASMLFEVRARFIARLGFAIGNWRILQYVTDGMKLNPAGPTFLQARDAILSAAVAGGASAADIADIWAGFAARGLGVFAQINHAGTGAGNTRVVENFNVPGESLPSLSINDVSVAEGNTGTTTAVFTVTLTNANGSESRVNYVTSDGTATSGETRTSTALITIPAGAPTATTGTSGPYPATLNVAGLTGTIQRLRVRLNGLTHGYPDDLDVLLVGPAGQKVLLMSDVGGAAGVSGIDLTFDDAAAAVADGGPLTTGHYSPTNIDTSDSFPVPAPGPPYASALASYNGSSPNGTWSLYVVDDQSADAGSLTSFSLIITTTTSDYVPATGVLTFPPGTSSRTIPVTINGDVLPEPSEAFIVTLSNALNAVINDGTAVGTILADDAVPPTSVDDVYTTASNSPLVVPAPGILANDNTNGGGALTAAMVKRPVSGVLALNADGSFTYTPETTFTGSATFTYRAQNFFGTGNESTVTIMVNSPPAPTAVNDAYAVAYGAVLNIAAPGVLANDESNGGGGMTAILTSTAANGSVALGGDGSFSYTANAGFVGVDRFAYTASNAGGAANVATVAITVGEPTTPQPPTDLYVDSVVGNVVTLRWTASPVGPAADSYLLAGGLTPGSLLASLPTGSASPIFTFVAPTGSFFVRVHQLSGADRSGASNEVPLHVNVPVAPSAPSALVANVNGSALDLVWRNTFGGGPPASMILDVNGATRASLPLQESEQASFPVVPAGSYTITVRAANDGGASPASNAVTVTIPATCSAAPQPPENFLFYTVGSAVHAVWDPASTGSAATSYIVEVGGPLTVSLPTSMRTISGVPPPGTYSMSVVAVNACGASAPTEPQIIHVVPER